GDQYAVYERLSHRCSSGDIQHPAAGRRGCGRYCPKRLRIGGRRRPAHPGRRVLLAAPVGDRHDGAIAHVPHVGRHDSADDRLSRRGRWAWDASDNVEPAAVLRAPLVIEIRGPAVRGTAVSSRLRPPPEVAPDRDGEWPDQHGPEEKPAKDRDRLDTLAS